MKWVDWPFLLDIPAPIEEVMQAIHTRCQFMGIAYLMGLRSDYSQEVVAQFYATLYVDQDENEMHFTLGGKRFKISVHEFASLFKLRGVTTTNQFSSDLVRLHCEDELEVTKMRFMFILVDSLLITRCSTYCLGTLFVLGVVIPITYLIELETSFIKWLPVNLSSMFAIFFGMRSSFVHTLLLVDVTMHRTFL
jgi:hypothetical protein